MPPKYQPRTCFAEPDQFGIRISAKLAKSVKLNDQRLWSSVLQHLYARSVLLAFDDDTITGTRLWHKYATHS